MDGFNFFTTMWRALERAAVFRHEQAHIGSLPPRVFASVPMGADGALVSPGVISLKIFLSLAALAVIIGLAAGVSATNAVAQQPVCVANSTWNATFKRCECNAGYFWAAQARACWKN